MTQVLTAAQPELLTKQFERGVEVFFASGVVAQMPVLIGPQEQMTFGLRLKIPREAKSGDTLRLDLVQRDARSKRILGGIAVMINVL